MRILEFHSFLRRLFLLLHHHLLLCVLRLLLLCRAKLSVSCFWMNPSIEFPYRSWYWHFPTRLVCLLMIAGQWLWRIFRNWAAKCLLDSSKHLVRLNFSTELLWDCWSTASILLRVWILIHISELSSRERWNWWWHFIFHILGATFLSSGCGSSEALQL